ncbi:MULTISPECIES: hypothetical protein [unclassified Rothia (in: high G+C Gram-positive bacteria)]|uniref:hypothetical protein n=1 Tax=unclassified Rothia (in: high G+C Gram-positive bacteria) TaxID=2689056 RepID=UPI00195EA967|nr:MULTISPECIES: hypothetical protein [unclassified Rothia (in: high G+C Gram-positive bacteria)]MBM7050952.1 hypothetical protein [Rothia sp. ZJ1223]QRZ62317.1 hypothetical protein JR346_04245 [Rothia sp. ZJ932]
MTSADLPAPALTTSRRALMLGALATGVGVAAASATKATAEEVIETPQFSYQSPKGFSLALWGSSTIENLHVAQGVPKGLDARIETSLKALNGIEVLNFGRSGEISSNILARRGVKAYRYRLVFPNDMIPASGSVMVDVDPSTTTEWNPHTVFPGYVQDIPGVLSAADGVKGQLRFFRLVNGEERYAPAGIATDFHSRQEMISRASHHLIQIGRNNLKNLAKLQEDTEAAISVAPETTLVMGHYPSAKQSPDSEQLAQVNAYNTWAANTYGDRYLDTMGWLRIRSQEPWLRYGDLAGSDVWKSDDDRKDFDAGNAPRSLYADDYFHLNGWGYLVISHMISAQLTRLGWV